MASRDCDDCELYFRLRVNEITDEMTRSLASAAERNQSLARLLRAKVEQRTGRDDRERRATLDTLAEMCRDLDQNNGQVTVVQDRLRGQLREIVDGLRRGGGDDDDHDDHDDHKGAVTDYGYDDDDVAKITADVARLTEIVQSDRETLARDEAEVRRFEDRLNRKQVEYDWLEKATAASIEAAEKEECQARAIDDGGCPSALSDDESSCLCSRGDTAETAPVLSLLTYEPHGWTYDDHETPPTGAKNGNIGEDLT